MASPEDPHTKRIRSAYARYDTQKSERRKRDLRNPGNVAIIHDREEQESRLLSDLYPDGLHDIEVLDVGCGRGALLEWLLCLGASESNLHGVDLLQDRIAAAKAGNPSMDLRCLDARKLPFQNGAFRLVVCSTVFSSIREKDVAAAVAAEVGRVTHASGAILWYDVRLPNPGNPDTIAMNLPRIRELFPGFRCELRSATLLPPLARRLGPLTNLLYSPLASVPFLRSHYVGVLRHA